MLEIRGLTAKRGKKTVLDGVDLTLCAGTFTALIGKNGSGKSTLLSCINRSRAVKYSGRLMFCGEDISNFSLLDMAKRITLLPQVLASPHITVRELVLMGRSPYLGLSGRISRKDEAAGMFAMETVGISDMADRYVDELSGGEHRKAYLAMSVCTDAECMLFDEPTTFMDPKHTGEMLSLMRELKEKKKRTVLAVMHDLNAAMSYADRIALLDDGRIVFEGNVREAAASGTIEKVFGVKKYAADGRVFYAT